MSREFSIRAASAADVPEIVALVGSYWDFQGIAGFAAARIAPLLQQLLRESYLGAIWVARTESELAGYLLAVWVFSLEYQGRVAEIDELFVAEHWRSGGVGAALVTAAETDLARSHGVGVQLQLGRDNRAAAAFYQRRGYHRRANYELLYKSLGRID